MLHVAFSGGMTYYAGFADCLLWAGLATSEHASPWRGVPISAGWAIGILGSVVYLALVALTAREVD